MGYRSDMALALQPQIVPHFEDACREVAASPAAFFKGPFHQDAAERHDGEAGTLLAWKDCKCYDWDEILMAFRRRIREAGYDRPDETFFSLRLGDDNADIQEVGEWVDHPFDIGFSRTLHYGF